LDEARLRAETEGAGAGVTGGTARGAARAVAGPDRHGADAGAVGLGEGDPGSERVYEDGLASGIEPAAKGPKPIVRSADEVAEDLRSTSRTRQRGPGFDPVPIGPASAEDAWKWEGVPPGRALIGPVEPGRMRHYMDNDGHGPCIKWLPAVWPPGHEGDGGA